MRPAKGSPTEWTQQPKGEFHFLINILKNQKSYLRLRFDLSMHPRLLERFGKIKAQSADYFASILCRGAGHRAGPSLQRRLGQAGCLVGRTSEKKAGSTGAEKNLKQTKEGIWRYSQKYAKVVFAHSFLHSLPVH